MFKHFFSTTPRRKSQFLLLANDYRDSEALARRLTVRQSHLDRAGKSKLDGTVLVGGAKLSGDKMIGSMMVLDFPSKEVADACIQSDPYVVGKVWETYTISPFKLTAIAQTPPVATQAIFGCRKGLTWEPIVEFGSSSRTFGGLTLSSKDSNSPNGSMFVLSALSQSEVEEHVKSDPFTTQNVWESWDIALQVGPTSCDPCSKVVCNNTTLKK
ncbi:UNVERIFIED_CONTAM: hypothetical protein HDU68_002612 [Siphonaria sp. JEL0065]|nr:hypothetical protein HDU68_002612 [Siphonaria sp. JEL0065]